MRWTAGPGVAWQSVGDEVVVLDVASGKAIGLNATGSFIWQRLEQDDDEIARALAREFALPAERAVSDVRTFLAELERRGLVHGAGAAATS